MSKYDDEPPSWFILVIAGGLFLTAILLTVIFSNYLYAPSES